MTHSNIYTGNNNLQIEFLDVLHVADESSSNGFYITDYVKPTAEGRRFLDGSSFHPHHVFKAIITGEAKRLRRLNTKDENYNRSVQRLKEKCDRSNFNKSVTDKMIQIVQNWNNMEEKKTNKEKDDKNNKKVNLTWPTQFKNLVKLNDLEKKLVPEASISFCKPPTLANQLLNYKVISHNTSISNNSKVGNKCLKCGLCGCHGKLKNNMVLEANTVQLNDGKTVRTKNHNLNCNSYGIYAALCSICNNIYVGQTKNSFTDRWNGHRATWKKLYSRFLVGEHEVRPAKDEQSLFHHYVEYHQNALPTTKPLSLSDAYMVLFLQQPPKCDLDFHENNWISKLNATINIQKTFLPKFK